MCVHCIGQYLIVLNFGQKNFWFSHTPTLCILLGAGHNHIPRRPISAAVKKFRSLNLFSLVIGTINRNFCKDILKLRLTFNRTTRKLNTICSNLSWQTIFSKVQQRIFVEFLLPFMSLNKMFSRCRKSYGVIHTLQ